MSLKNTDPGFIALLPEWMRQDPVAKATAEAFGAEYRRIAGAVPVVRPWENLDSQTEPVLGLMAYEVNPLFWDDAWPDAIKRRVLRGAARWRMIHGSPACVEEFTEAVMGVPVRAIPWWAYPGPFDGHGEPGRFRLSLPLPVDGLDCPARQKLLHIVSRSKNTRSHLDGLMLSTGGNSRISLGLGLRLSVRLRLYPPFARRINMIVRPRTAGAARLFVHASPHSA